MEKKEKLLYIKLIVKVIHVFSLLSKLVILKGESAVLSEGILEMDMDRFRSVKCLRCGAAVN